jgi:type I restriction enzyme, S subunit
VLEEMAKTIYNFWFVQFDFPDKHGKPYKTSGGNMVWNEELKRKIPEGWQVTEMSKLLVKNNVKYDYKGLGYDTIDLSVMPSSTMCLTERNHSDSFSTNLFYLKKFDILFGAIRPYLLKAGFAPFDGLVTGTVHSYRAIKKEYYSFALLTMIQESVFKYAVSNSKGTKMPVIGSDDLLGYKVPFDESIIKEIIAHNINENQKLTELRDWLLPMLMNGQVRVG